MLGVVALPVSCGHYPSFQGFPVVDTYWSNHKAPRRISTAGKNSAAMSRRHKVTVACVACKARKSRCTGTSPCENCVQLGTECIIDETLDGRRKVALNRRLDELVHHKWILEGLLLSLRTSKDEPLLDILDLVNEDAPLPVLAASISRALSKSPELRAQAKMDDPLQTDLGHLSRHAQGSTQSSSKMKDSWHVSNEPIDLLTLSQKLDEYARSVSLQESGDALVAHGHAHSPHGSLSGSQGYCYDTNSSQTSSFDCSTPAYDMYGTPQHLSTQKFKSEDVSLDNAVLWLREVKLLNDNKSSEIATNQSGDFQGGISQSCWYTPISGASTPSQLYKTSPDTRARLLKQDTRSSEARRKRPMHDAHGPSRPSPQMSISSALDRHPSGPRTPVMSYEVKQSRSSGLTAYTLSQPWGAMQNPGHLALPKTEMDDSPRARAISYYLDLARSMLSDGTPLLEVFGPDRPCLDLLFRERRPGDAHSVCNFAAELTGRVDGLNMTAKMAIAHMFTYLMRWMVISSAENYSKIPEVYRPTVSQVNIPHSMIVDYCPFPQLRDALCRRQRDFLDHVAPDISCNWPHDISACIDEKAETGTYHLSEHFARHAADAANWSLRSRVFKLFPECVGFVRVTS